MAYDGSLPRKCLEAEPQPWASCGLSAQQGGRAPPGQQGSWSYCRRGPAPAARPCTARTHSFLPFVPAAPNLPSPRLPSRISLQFHLNRAAIWCVVLLRVLASREWPVAAAVVLVLALPAVSHWLPHRLYLG